MNKENDNTSVAVARAAISLAITPTRADEEAQIKLLEEQGIKSAAVDVGGELVSETHVIIERAVLAARKNGIISESPTNDGVVAGAAKEAQAQIMQKAIGFNGGGKIAVCRAGTHVSVCVFMSVGMLYLNEVVVGLGHRVISNDL